MTFMQDDKNQRAKEREQDRQEMRDLISNGVKKEVETAIMPILEKQKLIEKENAALKDEYLKILQEMKEIKEKVSSGQDFPSLPSTK